MRTTCGPYEKCKKRISAVLHFLICHWQQVAFLRNRTARYQWQENDTFQKRSSRLRSKFKVENQKVNVTERNIRQQRTPINKLWMDCGPFPVERANQNNWCSGLVCCKKGTIQAVGFHYTRNTTRCFQARLYGAHSSIDCTIVNCDNRSLWERTA